jgi:hypothetical protein
MKNAFLTIGPVCSIFILVILQFNSSNHTNTIQNGRLLNSVITDPTGIRLLSILTKAIQEKRL